MAGSRAPPTRKQPDPPHKVAVHGLAGSHTPSHHPSHNKTESIANRQTHPTKWPCMAWMAASACSRVQKDTKP